MHQSFVRYASLCALVAGVVLSAVVAGQTRKPAAPDVTGKWVLTLDGSQGSVELNLSLKQTEQAVTGTLGELHELTLAVEGAWRDGKLVFTASGEGHGQALTLEFTGASGADGTLAGKTSTAMGEMTWKAVRVKQG